MVNYIDRFSNFKAILHFWGKPHLLIVIYYLFIYCWIGLVNILRIPVPVASSVLVLSLDGVVLGHADLVK